jgi:hypothetical protein
MKAILFIALLASSLFATEIHLKSFTYSAFDEYEPEFMVNKDLGRAWVNIVSWDDSDYDADSYDHFVKVEGLRLEGSDIVYNDTTCATVTTRGWRIFSHEVIKMTDKCRFTKKKVKVDYDDGFYVRKRTKMRVFLEVDEI